MGKNLYNPETILRRDEDKTSETYGQMVEVVVDVPQVMQYGSSLNVPWFECPSCSLEFPTTQGGLVDGIRYSYDNNCYQDALKRKRSR